MENKISFQILQDPELSTEGMYFFCIISKKIEIRNVEENFLTGIWLS